MASGSAKALSMALPAKRLRIDSTRRSRMSDMIINWGNSEFPNWWTLGCFHRTLNLPQYVSNASDKRKTFELLGELSGIDFTSDITVARDWFKNPRYPKKLNAAV
jgi:hypothetical protein